MTNLKSKIIETRTQADLNAIYQHDDYDIIFNKIKNLSPRGKEDLVAHLNIIVLSDAKYGNSGKITQEDKPTKAIIIPIDFNKKASAKQKEGVSHDA